MEFEFSKILEQALSWIVSHIDAPLWISLLLFY